MITPILLGFMIARIEKAFDDFASEMELCPCHGSFTCNLVPSQRALMFQKHYGNGYSECPLSAMHAPELADNQLRQRVEQSFNFAEADVLVGAGADRSGINAVGSRPRDRSDMDKVLGDLHRIESSALLELTVKCAFHMLLPWRFAILAHHNEDIARQGASEIEIEFMKDPREDAHDPMTWRLMVVSKTFRKDLGLFTGESTK